MLPETKTSILIDRFINRVGIIISWIWLVLLGIIVLNVTLRYVFDSGKIEFEEIQWHLYSTGFLWGLSLAYKNDSHIRVDVLRERLSNRMKAWIDLYGILLLLLPFIFLILFYAMPFVWASLAVDERSQAPGGLGYRWIIKSMLPFGFLLLALSTLSRLSRIYAELFSQKQEGH